MSCHVYMCAIFSISYFKISKLSIHVRFCIHVVPCVISYAYAYASIPFYHSYVNSIQSSTFALKIEPYRDPFKSFYRIRISKRNGFHCTDNI